MSVDLTVAIPTYNRAALLDKQLAWLARAVRGLEDRCELIVSDNASTDATSAVIERWRRELGGLRFRVQRHETNIGAVRNIASCIAAAAGRHVWTISDDDAIDDGALAYVLRVLGEHPDLALLALNFSSRHVKSGRLLFDRCFDVAEETVRADGKAVFERCLASRAPGRLGGLLLTTALVYRTDLAQGALREWPQGLDSLAVQLYWTAFCASRGAVLVTRDNHLECAAGTHFFHSDPKLRLSYRYADIPEAFAKLIGLGYDQVLCRRKVLEQARLFSPRFMAGCFRQWPTFTLAVLSRYARAAWRAQRGVLAAGRLAPSRAASRPAQASEPRRPVSLLDRFGKL